jgi:hypothetical protein
LKVLFIVVLFLIVQIVALEYISVRAGFEPVSAPKAGEYCWR